MKKKTLFIILGCVAILITIGTVIYLNRPEKEIGVETSKNIPVVSISGQKAEKRKSELQKVFSSAAIGKWGFGAIENAIIFVDENFSIVKYDTESKSLEKKYNLPDKDSVDSVNIQSNQNSCLVQFFIEDSIKTFVVTADSVKELAVEAIGSASLSGNGFVVPEEGGLVILSSSGEQESKVTSQEGETFAVSKADNLTCTINNYDQEAEQGKLVCKDLAEKGFSKNVSHVSKIYTNGKSVLVAFSSGNGGYALLYDASGKELSKITGIDPSSAVPTKEGYYIISRPFDFESLEIRENGVGFVKNSGEIRTIVDSDAATSYSIVNLATGKNSLYLREGDQIFAVNPGQ